MAFDWFFPLLNSINTKTTTHRFPSQGGAADDSVAEAVLLRPGEPGGAAHARPRHHLCLRSRDVPSNTLS